MFEWVVSKGWKLSDNRQTIPYYYEPEERLSELATEINVKQGVNNIPCTTGEFDFGEVVLNTSNSTLAFTVENLGNADLYLTGNPDLIQLDGGDLAEFEVNFAQTFSPVSPGSATGAPRSSGPSRRTRTASRSPPDRSPCPLDG